MADLAGLAGVESAEHLAGLPCQGEPPVKPPRQQEAAVAYHKAVLSAWNDVVNTLTAYKTEQVRREHLRAQVEHAKQALVLARSRYEQGVADITTLLSDAQSVLSAEQQLAQSQTNVSIDLIALFKALGGGLAFSEMATSAGGEQ
jgi:outer membrane protein TolC